MPPGGPWNVTPGADCAKMRLVIWRRICYNRSGHFGRRGPSGSPKAAVRPRCAPKTAPARGLPANLFPTDYGWQIPTVRRPKAGVRALRFHGLRVAHSRTGPTVQPYSQSKDAACHGKASAWPAGCPGQATVQKKKGRSKKRWTSTTRPG